jgi:predicted Zn-dependent protease with MMP-like domain
VTGRRATPRRIAGAALVALSLGLGAVALADGFSESFPVRLLQGVGLLLGGGTVLAVLASLAVARMADWRTPASEAEFEQLVRRSERLARDDLAPEPGEEEFLAPDPYDDEDFAELVREALDDLPDLLRAALERNVAVVISDDGARRRAYGLYHGDGVARDDVADRIVIYRDTLRRDFGADPEALRAQVTRTVRHELAHHLGWDELGVRRLGL